MVVHVAFVGGVKVSCHWENGIAEAASIKNTQMGHRRHYRKKNCSLGSCNWC